MKWPGSLSVRFRLTLWNMVVVAVALVLFGGALRFTVGQRLMGGIDRELQNRAFPMADSFVRTGGPPQGMPGGRPGPQGMPPDPAPLPPPQGHNGRPGGPGGFGFPGGPEGQGGQGFPFGGPEGRRQGENIRPGERGRPRPDDRFPVRVFGRDQHNLLGEGANAPLWSQKGYEQALRTAKTNFQREVVDGEVIRVFSQPVLRNGGVPEVVQTARPMGDLEEALDGVTRTLLMLLPAALLLAALGGALLTERALRPVREITGAARNIGEHDLAHRLPVHGDDEFGQLAAMLNGMLGRLDAAFQRQRRFTADASHELRTPLAVIKAHSSLALEEVEGDEKAEMQAIDQAADRANRIVRDMLFLARADSGSTALNVQTGRVEIGEVLRTAREAVLMTAAQGRGSTALPVVEVAQEGAIWLVSDRDHLVRLFTNLLDNAVRHTPTGGRVTVRALPAADGILTLRVTDTGEGIPPEHLARLGEPFYRPDAARTRRSGGAGLGLAICHGIARALGGSLRFESTVGQGTTAIVTLPLTPPPA
jgi:two-component system OmpR family sensor kinase